MKMDVIWARSQKSGLVMQLLILGDSLLLSSKNRTEISPYNWDRPRREKEKSSASSSMILSSRHPIGRRWTIR